MVSDTRETVMVTSAAKVYVDPTVDGQVSLVTISERMTCTSFLLTPVQAYRLAQMLISVAESVEMP